MFGKLLKNDLKAQWHSISAVFLCTFIIALVAEIFTMTSDEKVVKVMGGFLVSIALGFACIVIIIAVAMMFSKTMVLKVQSSRTLTEQNCHLPSSTSQI